MCICWLNNALTKKRSMSDQLGCIGLSWQTQYVLWTISNGLLQLCITFQTTCLCISYVLAYVRTYVCTYVHILRTYVRTYTCNYVHTFVRTNTYTYVRTCVRILDYVRTYVRTYIPNDPAQLAQWLQHTAPLLLMYVRTYVPLSLYIVGIRAQACLVRQASHSKPHLEPTPDGLPIGMPT